MKYMSPARSTLRMLAVGAMVAFAAAVAADPTPATPEALSLSVAHSLIDNHFADVVSLFDAKLAGALPEANLAAAWKQTITPMGPLLKIGTPTAQQFGPNVIAIVPLTYQKGPINLVVTQAGGKIVGIFLRPGGPAAAP